MIILYVGGEMEWERSATERRGRQTGTKYSEREAMLSQAKLSYATGDVAVGCTASVH